MGAFFPALSPSSLWNRKKKNTEQVKERKKEKEGGGKEKSTGSAVTGMQLSIQDTHPCRTSKTGLYSHPPKPRLALRHGTPQRGSAAPLQGL